MLQIEKSWICWQTDHYLPNSVVPNLFEEQPGNEEFDAFSSDLSGFPPSTDVSNTAYIGLESDRAQQEYLGATS